VLVKTRGVGAGAAHVERDDGLQAANGRHPRSAGCSAGRSAEETVPGLKTAVRTQRSSTAHDQKVSFSKCREAFGNAVEVRVYDGRQVGVDKGCLHTAEQLDGRREAAAERQVGVAGGAQRSTQLLLVRRIAVGVEQGNGHRRLITGLNTARNFFGLQRKQRLAIGSHALANTHNPGRYKGRRGYVQLKKVGPLLVANEGKVLKAFRNIQEHGTPLSLEQRIGPFSRTQPESYVGQRGRQGRSRSQPGSQYGRFFSGGEFNKCR